MAEAVIVATSRTPIGRANKGSLVEARPDDMSAFIIRDVLEKVPELTAADIGGHHLGNRPTGRRGWLQHRPGRGAAGRGRRSRGDRQPLLLLFAPDDPDGCSCDQGGRG